MFCVYHKFSNVTDTLLGAVQDLSTVQQILGCTFGSFILYESCYWNGFYIFQGEENIDSSPWLQYMSDGNSKLLAQEMDFSRPDESTDKLYMSIGGSDVIEVSHPLPPEGVENIR